MATMPAAPQNFTMELHHMDAAASAAAAGSERAKWLLTSSDPPPPWKQLYASFKEKLLPGPKSEQKTRAKRPLVFLEGLFPILKWGRNYKATKFKNDLMAGLTLASLCIPQVCTN